MQKWRDTPVYSLYERIREILERGEPSPQVIEERIHHIRTQVEKELTDLMDKTELDLHFARFVPRYLLSMTPGAVARHIRMERHLRQSAEPFALEVSLSDRAAEITLMSEERPGLLARVAGICTLHDMNIVGAQVFSMSNDLLLLIFQCRLPEKLAVEPEWEAVKHDMRKLLDGRIALDFRIAAHAVGRQFPDLPRQTPSTIKIDNDSSALYTILEVYTADRVGLLYTITRTLYDLQIRIAVAKITTKVDQAADVFYIRTYTGGKVIDPEQIKEIKNALCFWLDGPEGNCPGSSD
jgi:[protein-PII] uridylyltransferase